MRAAFGSARVWLLAAACFSVSSLATAQEPGKITASVGYEAFHVDNNPCTGCTWNWYPIGLALDTSYALRGSWSLVGEFGWLKHAWSDEEDLLVHSGGMNALDAGGGLRWNATGKRKLKPYAQLTAGYHRDFATGPPSPGFLEFVGDQVPANSFMVHPAGGALWPMGGTWGFVGQLGYRRVFSDPGINGFHVVVGVRFTAK